MQWCAVGRERIKLSVEKHGNGVRFKRTHKKELWKSKTFTLDSRENRREAWSLFQLWRDERDTQPTPQSSDPHSLLRQMLSQKAKALVEHAEFSGDPKGAKFWRELEGTVPSMSRDELFKLAAVFVGEVNGKSFREIVADREKTVAKIKANTDSDLSARSLADKYIERFRRKMESGRCSPGHYGQVKVALDKFVNWFGAARSLGTLSEKSVRDYTEHLEGLVDEQEISRSTAHHYQQAFRSFISHQVEDYPDDVPLPKNLRSKSQLIHAERKEPNPFTISEVQLLLKHAVPRTKLFLMLMLNCAMYQGDIADLAANEIDWKAGRIIRPRSKAARRAAAAGTTQPAKVNWLLWRETWKLFQQFANREGLCLRAEGGGDLITHKPTTRNDAIRSAFNRLIAKLKRRKLLPEQWKKTLKQFRKTGANLLEKSKEHGQFYSLYLNHSVARQHYLTTGEPVPAFDEAVKWLGKQFGIK